jgi:hypothetical protein
VSLPKLEPSATRTQVCRPDPFGSVTHVNTGLLSALQLEDEASLLYGAIYLEMGRLFTGKHNITTLCAGTPAGNYLIKRERRLVSLSRSHFWPILTSVHYWITLLTAVMR